MCRETSFMYLKVFSPVPYCTWRGIERRSLEGFPDEFQERPRKLFETQLMNMLKYDMI